MDKRVVITALVSAIGGGLAGGAITYLTVKKTFAQRAQNDIDEVKKAYAEKFEGKRVIGEYINMPGPDNEADEEPKEAPLTPGPEDVARVEDFVRSLGYNVGSERAEEAREEQTVSIYDAHVENPPGDEVEDIRLVGYSWEDRKRDNKPYLISEQEFHTTQTEWEKSSYTYFEGDDVLVDEQDRPIDDKEYVIGEIHLELFGIRATDKNQVFVRAPQLSADYEITRNSSTYTEVIHGVIPGGEKLGVRRFRGDDD